MAKQSKIDRLLVETYRPTTVDDYVFNSPEVERKVRKWIKQGSIPNILLTGGPGTGKSTLSQILVNAMDVQPSDVFVINASTLKVAQIEDVLLPWMKKAGFSPFKIVRLEEADRISDAGQKILRSIIEDFSDSVRFIATANYPKKISAPLHSRFQHVVLDAMDFDGVLDLVTMVIDKEGLTFGSEEDVLSHIEAYEPDIRKILNSIDECTDEEGVIAGISASAAAGDVDGWIELWKADGELDVMAALGLSEHIDQSNYDEFYEVMYNNHDKFPDPARGLVLLSEYLDRAQRAANQRLHLDAFLMHVFLVEE